MNKVKDETKEKEKCILMMYIYYIMLQQQSLDYLQGKLQIGKIKDYQNIKKFFQEILLQNIKWNLNLIIY